MAMKVDMYIESFVTKSRREGIGYNEYGWCYMDEGRAGKGKGTSAGGY